MASRKKREPPYWAYYVTNKKPITVHLEMIKILHGSGYWCEVKKAQHADLLIGGHSGKGILGTLVPAVKQDNSTTDPTRNKALQQLRAADEALANSQKKKSQALPRVLTHCQINESIQINYFPGASLLCDKAKQVRTLRAYCRLKKIPIDQIMPQSFVVSPGCWNTEEFEFLKEFRRRQNIHLPSVPIYPQSVQKVLSRLVMKKLWSVGDRTAHGSNAFHRLVLTDRSSTALHPGGKVVQINANGSLVVRYRNGERATIRHPGLVRECDDAQRNVWILKPSNGQCGANIIITNRMSKIQTCFKRAGIKGHTVVVQKYLENPMTLKPFNRKFDMRTWVLVTSKFEVCVYHKGVLRTACEPFRLCGTRILDNNFVHLSNHCIQAKHPKFGVWEDSNEMLWGAFDEYLRKYEGINFNKDIFPKMCAIVILTLRAVEKRLCDPTNHYASFQLFGYDFMVTDDKKVQLLEVNSSPAIAERLLDEMTWAILHMAIQPMFPSPVTTPPMSSVPADCASRLGQWEHGWHVIDK